MQIRTVNSCLSLSSDEVDVQSIHVIELYLSEAWFRYTTSISFSDFAIFWAKKSFCIP